MLSTEWAPKVVAVNPVANKIYVGGDSLTVTVVQIGEPRVPGEAFVSVVNDAAEGKWNHLPSVTR